MSQCDDDSKLLRKSFSVMFSQFEPLKILFYFSVSKFWCPKKSPYIENFSISVLVNMSHIPILVPVLIFSVYWYFERP